LLKVYQELLVAGFTGFDFLDSQGFLEQVFPKLISIEYMYSAYDESRGFVFWCVNRIFGNE
jgi:hypothetical protein